MDIEKHLVILRGNDRKCKDRTSNIESITKNRNNTYSIRFTKSSKSYFYSCKDVLYLSNPKVILPADDIYVWKIIKGEGRKKLFYDKILFFKNSSVGYYKVFNGQYNSKIYSQSDLIITGEGSKEKKSTDVFSYLNEIAKNNVIDFNSADQTESDETESDKPNKVFSLGNYYKYIGEIFDKSPLNLFLNQGKAISKTPKQNKPIFPFGCNSSQYKAVNNALNTNVSAIQGPPGTGKTQTILNILANLVIQEKTALVVSNNNSAIYNIKHKLDKSSLGFIVAMLGKNSNKTSFIHEISQYGSLPANFENDILKRYNENCICSQLTDSEIDELIKSSRNKLDSQLVNLAEIYESQERLARVKRLLSSTVLEQKHFDKEFSQKTEQYVSKVSALALAMGVELESNTEDFTNDSDLAAALQVTSENLNRGVNSEKVLEIAFKLNTLSQKENEEGFLNALWFKIKVFFNKLFARKSKYPDFFDEITSSEKIVLLYSLYYKLKVAELLAEKEELTQKLQKVDSKTANKEMSELSMFVFAIILYKKYRNLSPMEESDFPEWNQEPSDFLERIPIILSTTFSSKKALNTRAEYDYLIMDEASQVGVATGALALSCAKNAVVVGDSKQLKNIVDDEAKEINSRILSKYNIPSQYDCATNNFLDSFICSIKDIPVTLLSEHYRCHPNIIEFCNQKFYGGELVPMTEDAGEKDTFSIQLTGKENFARGNKNEREIAYIEQIIEDKNLKRSEVGVITPYNTQVDALNKRLNADVPEEDRIKVSTVHKFQGQEKDTIIISFVKNEVNDFIDQNDFVNVAVSRAVKNLFIVMTKNVGKNNNLSDMLEYAAYHNIKTLDYKVHSVFDLLYKENRDKLNDFRKKHAKVSEFDSENILYALITEIFAEDSQFRTLDVACHVPLFMIFSDFSSIEDDDVRRYASHSWTHVDFLIYSKISKQPLLAIELDGTSFHKEGSVQGERDQKKNRVFKHLNLPLLRLRTDESNEKQKIISVLSKA